MHKHTHKHTTVKLSLCMCNLIATHYRNIKGLYSNLVLAHLNVISGFVVQYAPHDLGHEAIKVNAARPSKCLRLNHNFGKKSVS